MVPVFLCAGARKEISSESCTRPARRVVEKSIPLLDCAGPCTKCDSSHLELCRQAGRAASRGEGPLLDCIGAHKENSC